MERALTRSMRGTIISIHEYGATARLEDGTLAAIAAAEFSQHRPTYVASRDGRRPIELYVERLGRHRSAVLIDGAVIAPDDIIAARPVARDGDEVATRTDIAFEMRIGAYLRETETWAPPDRPAPAERHFIRKKHRAEIEARKKTT